MTGDEAYRWLIDASVHSECDPFDIHVAASILALALAEMEAMDQRSLGDGAGLGEEELNRLSFRMFPAIAGALQDLAEGSDPEIGEEEQSVRDILLMYASGAGDLERTFAAMIARRCKAPHHLWQDLGLRHRGELSELMERHFSRLSARNSEDMKWKKFLYRMVCGSAGFSLCTSPVCSDCDDFDNCFGDESGEARLARIASGVAGQPC
ncbi:nitrogen fixation protein NifQ [Roseibium litorale]|uniref:Nitrogen fixation protein NifQ n=1 Tax=Roseibium litorale TaxID=2803841 RepID=A0ABR9CRT4_9HYPH|nr:nitrogen fixation protein NifQ [Roseibium litorale]MBD8893334.1 nitrogen fixation protein NifQ [Roseibium litorale]